MEMDRLEETEEGSILTNAGKEPARALSTKSKETQRVVSLDNQSETRRADERTKRSREASKGDDDAKAKFYCEPCGKQYQTAMEWEMHLSSYDHHHKKRWKEMNQMVAGRTKKQRLKKEQKQLTRDLDAFAEQFERARKEEETLEASKPKAEAKNLTTIQQTTSTGMVFHLRTGKKQPQNQSRSSSQTSVDKTRDIFGNDSDD